MKKLLICAVAAASLSLASCSSIRHTSTTVPVETEIRSHSTADLKVSQKKISYTYKPSKAVRRCGQKAVIATAVAEALKANGNADVLVGFQYEIKKTRNFFGRNNIKYVTVEGYPATYVNITPLK
ncbi:MAG: hypothetical protein K2I26_02810 [Paramuribaculum sp.]|nr:hypothetical protein [Paramuribaculum sp.]